MFELRSLRAKRTGSLYPNPADQIKWKWRCFCSDVAAVYSLLLKTVYWTEFGIVSFWTQHTAPGKKRQTRQRSSLKCEDTICSIPLIDLSEVLLCHVRLMESSCLCVNKRPRYITFSAVTFARNNGVNTFITNEIDELIVGTIRCTLPVHCLIKVLSHFNAFSWLQDFIYFSWEWFENQPPGTRAHT